MSQKKTQLFNPLNGNINVTGVVTASSFSGDGSGLTGVASTDNIQTTTPVNVLNNVRITGFTTAGAVSASNLNVSGVSTFSGNLTGVAATFSGNVTIGGTLTYQDVEHIDSVGIITAQQGIQVLANGLDITGVSTFNDNITTNGSNIVLGVSGTNATQHRIVLGSQPGYLQIYNHSGATSIIDGGNAHIVNKTTVFQVQNPDSELMLRAANAGSVDLYYDASKKFETTDDGIAVAGVVTAISGIVTYYGDGSALTGISSWEVFDTWLYGGG